jgi:hypothetical protein
MDVDGGFMKRCVELIVFFAILSASNQSFAACNCDDWVDKGGYCVDYVKTKISTFPIPKSVAEITTLKNKETSKVEEGDVAIFDLGNYWHVAYVEKVHVDSQGSATAIDVSEMNFGGRTSFDEYKKRWHTKNEGEWKRALCCGVTKKYDRTSTRKNVALNSIEQIWSPDIAVSQENSREQRDDSLLDKAREALNNFIQFTGREL